MKISLYDQYDPIINESLVSLIVGTQQNEFNINITLEDQPDLLQIQQFYQAFWVAVEDSTVIGTAGFLFFGDNCGAIRKMFVDKSHRGRDKSIAQSLLDTIVTYSAEYGIKALYLDTLVEFKAAIRFYERNGFVEIPQSELPVDYPIVAPQITLNRLFFKKELMIQDSLYKN